MKVLVVDDQRSMRLVLRGLLERVPEVTVVEAASLEEALATPTSELELAFVDLRLGSDVRDRSGLEVVRHLVARGVARVVVVTGFDELSEVRAAMRSGAFDYLLKEQLEEALIGRVVEEVRSRRALERELMALRARSGPPPSLIGSSRAMVSLRERIARVALSNRPVLVTGPSGCGKELVAAAIHAMGPAPAEPLIDLNVAALPESLVEATLFGHVRGAFTGADQVRAGALASARRGTVFLDEIAELAPAHQPKLLRVLEQGSFRPVGSDQERAFEGRVVAATHQRLEALVASGRFREDLYHRLAVLKLEVPALVDRREDVPELVAHFAGKERPTVEFDESAVALLSAQPWPGNVRQLRNVVDQVRVFVDERPVRARHLEPFLVAPGAPDALAELARAVLRSGGPGDRLALAETVLVQEAMALTGGNQSAAARLLGVHRKRLERRWAARVDEPDQGVADFDHLGGSKR
jgi:DNA-binding NtrC family response regulator